MPLFVEFRGNIKAWLLSLLLCLFVTVSFTSSVRGDSPYVDVSRKAPLNVLFISSFTKDLPAQGALERGLNRSLGFKQGTHNMVFEFIGVPQARDKGFDDSFVRYLTAKYHSTAFDTVVAWDIEAHAFLKRVPKLFKQADRFYLEASDPSLQSNERALSLKDDHRITLTEALSLTEAKRVYVVGSRQDMGGMTRWQHVKEALAEVASGLHVEYLLDLPLTELQDRLSKLPDHSLIYYTLMFSDGQGRNMTPYQVVQQLAPVANAPIFTHWESLLGSGVVGGTQLSIEQLGYQLGLEILSPAKTSVRNADFAMRQMYDWVQLQRWGLEPPISKPLLINEPQGLWAKYHTYLILIALFIIALVTLAVFLMRALRTRNRALADLDIQRSVLAAQVEERTEELSQSRQELLLLLQASGDGLFGLDKRGTLTFMNTAATQMLGWEKEELLGQSLHKKIHHSHAEGEEYPLRDCRIYATLKDGLVRHIDDESFWRKGNQAFPVEYIVTPVLVDERITGVVVSFRDVTERRKAEQEIVRLATTDSLTGLANRNLYHQRLNDAIEAADASGDSVALLAIDLDNFKPVNDTLGHPAGDKVLKAIAQRLLRLCRSNDLLARVGGDEFSLLVTSIEAAEPLDSLAERLIDAVAEPIRLDGEMVYLGVSVGIARYPGEAKDAEQLIQHADRALYQAKHAGKNTWQVLAE